MKFIVREEYIESICLINNKFISDHLLELLECELTWNQVSMKII